MASLMGALGALLEAENASLNKQAATKKEYMDKAGLMPTELMPTDGGTVTSGGQDYSVFESPADKAALDLSKAQTENLEADTFTKEVSAGDDIWGNSNFAKSYGNGASGIQANKLADYVQRTVEQGMTFKAKELAIDMEKMPMLEQMAFTAMITQQAIESGQEIFGTEGKNPSDVKRDLYMQTILRGYNNKAMSDKVFAQSRDLLSADNFSDVASSVAKIETADYNERTGENIKVSVFKGMMDKFSSLSSAKTPEERNKILNSIINKETSTDVVGSDATTKAPPAGQDADGRSLVKAMMGNDPQSRSYATGFLQEIIPQLMKVPGMYAKPFTNMGKNIYRSMLSDKDAEAVDTTGIDTPPMGILNAIKEMLSSQMKGDSRPTIPNTITQPKRNLLNPDMMNNLKNVTGGGGGGFGGGDERGLLEALMQFIQNDLRGSGQALRTSPLREMVQGKPNTGMQMQPHRSEKLNPEMVDALMRMIQAQR